MNHAPAFDHIVLIQFHGLEKGLENKGSFADGHIKKWRRNTGKYVYEHTLPGHYTLLVGEDAVGEVDAHRDIEKSWLLHIYLTREHVCGGWDREGLKRDIMYALDHSTELRDIVLFRLHAFEPGLENEKGWLNTRKSRVWTNHGYTTINASIDEDVWLNGTTDKLRKHLEVHLEPKNMAFYTRH